MASNITDRANGFNSSSAVKIPVAAATTANITLSAEQTIDGITTSSDRVLVKNQTTTTENGIYDTGSGDWTRAPDFDGARDVLTGTLVYVVGGTANGNEFWYVSTAGDPSPSEVMAFTQSPLGGAATTAAGVSFSNTASGLSATDAQAALDELAENYILPKGTNVASATSTEIGAADSSFVSITGTTTITSFGSTGDRDHMWLQFNSALTLTHDGTKLILPTSANITTAAGDTLLAIRVSGENWKVMHYQRVDGTPLVLSDIVNDTTPQLGGPLDTNSFQVKWSKGADVASANAMTLGTDGNYFDITGTTAITSIGTLGIGTVVKLHFDGILTLTHHATDLILPSGANITTAAGDEAEFAEYATGDFRCTNYTKASGGSIVKSYLQIQSANIAAATDSTTFPDDNNTPLASGGSEVVTDNITPFSTSNKVKVSASMTISGGGGQSVAVVLFRGSTAIDARIIEDPAADQPHTASFNIIDSPSSASAVTYSIRVGSMNAAGTWYCNRLSSVRFNGVMAGGHLILEEIEG